MALKITSQIGTDKGITSEAYVRITNYELNKYGSANFRVEIFQSEEDANTLLSVPASMSNSAARNQQIGDSLYVPLTAQVEETITVQRTVPVEVEYEEEVPGVMDSDGNTIIETVTRTRTEMQQQDVEETITKIVPDLSSAEGVDIFAFGYSHLKAKLVDLFGEENIVDC